MRLLVSASNELPDEDSGLEALYDRMLVRIFVNRIQNKQNFKSMLTVGTIQEAIIPEGLAITEHEYHQWQSELEQLELSDATFEKLYVLKQMLENAAAQCSEIDESEMYISDRRWKNRSNCSKPVLISMVVMRLIHLICYCFKIVCGTALGLVK